MPWRLDIWFGYSDRADPAIVRDFESKAEGIALAKEVLADGLTETVEGVYHHFPANAITHVRLGEYELPEEEE